DRVLRPTHSVSETLCFFVRRVDRLLRHGHVMTVRIVVFPQEREPLRRERREPADPLLHLLEGEQRLLRVIDGTRRLLALEVADPSSHRRALFLEGDALRVALLLAAGVIRE